MAKESEKSKLELAKEAQIEVQESLNAKRIEFLESLHEFNGIGGTDDIEQAVMKIVRHFKPGIPLIFLQTVSPEAVLSKALKKLTDEGKIKKAGKKGNLKIELVEAK